ncbi:alpha/beta hydrolase fold domain-containing protein [Sphingomonas solaris]|nr:alpha/beta hydrolase fold domain-containing protein [Sphingomonas solaris]
MEANDQDLGIAGIRAQLAQRASLAKGIAMSWPEIRAGMDAATALIPPAAGCSSTPRDVGGVPGEEVVFGDAAPAGTILFLHGGGYVMGGPQTHRTLSSRFAKATRAAVVVIDYRLAPEHPFPAALDDAEAAYRALLAEGRTADRIVIAGDSAGGGLALALALRLKALGLPQPAGLFVISPWTDLLQSSDTCVSKAASDPIISKEGLDAMAGAYLGGAAGDDPLASPVRGDFAGIAPMLIHVGAEEVLLGDSIALAGAAGAAGAGVRLEIWPEMIHVWHAFADRLAPARDAIAVAATWINERLAAAR